MSVPRTVATIVEMNAITRLFAPPRAGPVRPSGSDHASSEKVPHWRFDLPAGSLKLNAIMTTTGRIR